MDEEVANQEELTSINAVRARYDEELLDLSTDLNVTLQIMMVQGEDGEDDEMLIVFPEQQVSMLAEEGPWTLEEIAEGLDVTPEALSEFSCAVNISVAPTLDDDDERTEDHLLISLLDGEGDYVVFGYGWRDDEGEWTPDEVARIFGIPLDAPVWVVSDATEVEYEDEDEDDSELNGARGV